MWRSIPSGNDIGLGVARGAIAMTGGGTLAVCTKSFEMPSTSLAGPRASKNNDNDLPSALRRAAAQMAPGRRRARVVIGNDLSCHWILAPSPGVRSLHEIQAVAQARFAALFDERGAEWELTADWRSDRPFLCAAVPKWVLLGITAATPHSPAPRSAATVFGRAIELFHRSLPEYGWCCIRSAHSLALMFVREGLPITLRILPLAQGLSLDATLNAGVQALHCEAACLALEPVSQATWLDLAEPAPADGVPMSRLHAGVRFKVLRLRPRQRAGQVSPTLLSEASLAALLGTPVRAVLS